MSNALLFAIACAVVLAGCGSTYSGQAASLGDAMNGLEERLASASYLSESDLLSEESSSQFQAARTFVIERQCASRSANPLVLIYAPISLTLRGSVDSSGSIRYSEVRPADSSGRAPGSSFDVPLRVSPVASFPNEYLKDMTALVETKGIPAELAQKLRREMAGNYERLASRVQSMINRFNPGQCAWPRPYERRRAETIFVPPTF